ncbi:MAG: flagellar hook basal-body protein [Syntrophobacterales bacterium]|nr:flagellar hook basal-body protein [Syntrophobacterales bacterium]
MSRVYSISLSGMTEAARRMNVIAHNVANIQTSGFRAKRLHSADVVDSNGRGLGVATLATTHSTVGAPLIESGEWSHLSISGSGYFAVQDSNGKTYYSRNGSFHLNNEGFLVNDQGHRLMNAQENPIPPLDYETYSSFKIDEEGRIWGTGSDGTTEMLGADYQVGIATFPNEGGLVAEGGTLYSPSPQSGPPTIGPPKAGGRGEIISGLLEGSNVSIEEEMVSMVMAKAVYSANAKVISTENDMNRALLDIKA